MPSDTENVSVLFALTFPPSYVDVAVAVALYTPGVSLGVPEIVRVDGLNVRPFGSPVTLYNIVPFPPVATGSVISVIAIPLSTLVDEFVRLQVIGILVHTAYRLSPAFAL